MKLFKRILAFVLALLLIIPAVQFNFGSGVDKAYAVSYSYIYLDAAYDTYGNLYELYGALSDVRGVNSYLYLYKNHQNIGTVYVDDGQYMISYANIVLKSNNTFYIHVHTVFDSSNYGDRYFIYDSNTNQLSSSSYLNMYTPYIDDIPGLSVSYNVDNDIMTVNYKGKQASCVNNYGDRLYTVPSFNNFYVDSIGNIYFVATFNDYYNSYFNVIFKYDIMSNSLKILDGGRNIYFKIAYGVYIISGSKGGSGYKTAPINTVNIVQVPSVNGNIINLYSNSPINIGEVYLNINGNFTNMGGFNNTNYAALNVNNPNTTYNGFLGHAFSDGTFEIMQTINNIQSYSDVNLSYSTGSLNWSNNAVTRGTGYVTLNWPSVPLATGYKVWVFDGNAYRAFDVGNTTSWDSRTWRIWPDMNWLNSQGDNTVSTDTFNYVKGGGQLPDDPNLLYRKTVGTTYNNSHNYWFKISAYNQYGESQTSNPVTPTLPNMTDTNVPVISSFTIDDGAAKTGSPQLKLSISATDTGGSGLSKIEISTDNFATIQQTVSASGNSFSTTINNFQVPATPGTINVYVRVWDVAGNVSTVQKAQIALMNDVTPPTAQLKINNGASFTTSPNVTLYITAYDDWTPIDQLQMRLSNDGKNWTAWGPLSLTQNWALDNSSQGYKSVFLQVQDASSNVGTTSAGILYSTDPNVIRGTQADTTPPTISYLSLAKGATVTTSFTPTVTLVASDNVTPQNQLHVYASADGVNWVDLGLLTSYNITLPSGLVTSGFNSIEFKIEDRSYNDAVRTLEFFKL